MPATGDPRGRRFSRSSVEGVPFPGQGGTAAPASWVRRGPMACDAGPFKSIRNRPDIVEEGPGRPTQVPETPMAYAVWTAWDPSAGASAADASIGNLGNMESPRLLANIRLALFCNRV